LLILSIGAYQADARNLCDWHLGLFGRAPKAEYLEVKDNEPTIYRQLYISPQQIAHPRLAFEKYLELRLSEYNILFRRKILSIIAQRKVKYNVNGVIGASLVFLRHRFWAEKVVDFLSGEGVLIMTVEPGLASSALFYSVLAHEVEHLIQLNDSRFTRLGEIRDYYLKEFGATRAEWEYWKLIPVEVIAREFAYVQTLPEHNRKTFWLQKLRYAKSSFSQFHDVSDYSTVEEVARGRSLLHGKSDD